MTELINKYVSNTEKLRVLSTPSLDEIDSPSGYELVLRSNFKQIAELAAENRRILSDTVFPILDGTKRPVKAEIDALISFCRELIHSESMENLDIPLSNRISSSLWNFVRYSGYPHLIVAVASLHINTCYLMMNYSKRTYPFSDLCETYRREGMEMCDIMEDYLPYDIWIELPSDELRKHVLELLRFKAAFFEYMKNSPRDNEEEMRILRRAVGLSLDDRYMSVFTDEEKIEYQLRNAEYFGIMLEAGNRRGFGYMQCLKIAEQTRKFKQLWERYPEVCSNYMEKDANLFMYYRSMYYAGELSAADYKGKMLEIYQNRNQNAFRMDDVYLNLILPIDYMMLIGRHQIYEVESSTLEQFYQNAINYIFKLPNNGVLVYTLEYLQLLLSQFREIPGGTTFEDIGLNCLAALHPPTYVHSKMVAAISRCLCKHLIRYYPQYMLDFAGESDPGRVAEHREEILDFAYHSALCHDFGKLAIIDTVFVYGRNIMDSEFTQIKSHPEIGAMILERNASTARYVNIARGHHVWYNGQKGYPFDFDSSRLKEKVIIELVSCADCMDAATDTTGRCYNNGITLEQFIGEVQDGAGTRYAPYLPELLTKEDVLEDLRFLLSDMRNLTYKETFIKLRRVQLLGED